MVYIQLIHIAVAYKRLIPLSRQVTIMPIDVRLAHEVLRNVDILGEIFEYLDPTSTLITSPIVRVESSAYRTCFYLSRVCKAFTEPALDLLWKIQVNFCAFRSLLSSFAQGEQPTNVSNPN